MSTLEIVDDDTLWVPNVGGQAAFMDDYDHRFCALAGGWYAGKTWAGARKCANIHLHNAFDDDGDPTGVNSLIVGQDYSLATTINVREMRDAFDEMGLAHRFVADPKKYWFELPDLGTPNHPSLVYIRSADAPTKINGFTVGNVWGDEVARWPTDDQDPTRDPLTQTLGRLRDPKARVRQANFTFTHEGDDTKVYRDFEEMPKPDHVLYRAGTFDNPHARQFAEDTVAQLTPELKAQYIDGTAASLKGSKVYTSYDDVANKDASLALASELPLHLAVDFNISPGMHAIVGQHIPQADLLTAVHEIHAPRMDVRRMVADLVELVKSLGGWRWPELWLFGDPSGNSKWSASGDLSAWDILRQALQNNEIPYKIKYGISAPPVGDRVNAVNCALKTIDGRIRYRVHPRCERLIADFKQMKWENGELGKKDRKLSHASDADGYRVHWLMPVRKLQLTGGRVGLVSQ
jgi:hypothetical protein